MLLLALHSASTSARKYSEEQGDADTDTAVTFGGGDYSLGATRTHSGGKEQRGLQISGNQFRGRPGSDVRPRSGNTYGAGSSFLSNISYSLNN